MPSYPELALARADMAQQSELYRPTIFWDEASAKIVAELEEHGIEKFRSLNTALWFYAPTYGVPGNSFTAEQAQAFLTLAETQFPNAKKVILGMQQFLSGEMAALADFRVLKAADDTTRLPHLHTFTECKFGSPIEHFEFEGRLFSRSALNYLLGLALLKKHLGHDVPRTVLEIGGGFGTLGEVLSQAGIDDLRYIDIDIPPTSFVAEHYLKAALGSDKVANYAQTRELAEIEINSLPLASVLCAWQIEKLRGNVDLFVNFISFQEMEPPIVQNYLKQVARLSTKWVLLRNMREGKQKRGAGHLAGVETPILGDDYLAMLPGYELVERQALPFGFRTVDGFHSELLLLRRA
jgi:putative sugar O-methyltransferase